MYIVLDPKYKKHKKKTRWETSLDDITINSNVIINIILWFSSNCNEDEISSAYKIRRVGCFDFFILSLLNF